MVVVLISITSQPYGSMTRPVGKCFASKIDDEKMAFCGRSMTDKDKKITATSMIGEKSEIEGQNGIFDCFSIN